MAKKPTTRGLPEKVEYDFNQKEQRWQNSVTNVFKNETTNTTEIEANTAKSLREAINSEQSNKENFDLNFEQLVELGVVQQQAKETESRREEAIKAKVEEKRKADAGETGFGGFIKAQKEGFTKMLEEQKSVKQIFQSIGGAINNDLQILGNLLGPLQALPGVNTAITILKSAGLLLLKGIWMMMTKDGRIKAMQWLKQKKQWVMENYARARDKINNRMKILKQDGFKGTGTKALKAGGNILKKVVIVIAGLAALLIGLFVGFGSSISKLFKLLIPTRVAALFSKMGAGIRSTFTGKTGIGGIVTQVRGFFTGIGKSVSGYFKGGKLATGIGKIGNVFKPLTNGIARLMKNPLVKNMFRLGKNLGKLFFPITILMGAIKSVTGFIDGFKGAEGGFMEKMIGGISGAIESLFDFFIAMPLDLIKDIFGWIAGKLGFEGVKEKLASFSFSDVFGKIFDILNSMISALTAMMMGFGNGVKQGIKALLPGGESPTQGFKRGFKESMEARGRVGSGSRSGLKIDMASADVDESKEYAKASRMKKLFGRGPTVVTTNVNNTTTKKIFEVVDPKPSGTAAQLSGVHG